MKGTSLLICLLLAAGMEGGGPVVYGQEVRGGSQSDIRIRPRNSAPGLRQTAFDLRLKLPFPEGRRYEVYQGNGGRFSHAGLNRHAWDFGLPEGTPVVAAAEGRVVRVKQDSQSGGLSQEHFSTANTIILDHGNGLFSQYLHLKKNSAVVSEGAMVRSGELLALSGNTGYSSTPHLHFQIQDVLGQSLPARFVDVPGDGVPRTGDFLTSANDGRGTTPYAGESRLPAEIFAGNGVQLESDALPAHLLNSDKPYPLRGTVKPSVRKVAVYLMGPQGGRPLYTRVCDVGDDGCFAAQLAFTELRALPNWSDRTDQSNAYTLAIAPVAGDGSFWSSFSVPVSIR